jgi:hypothetical protein
MECSTHGVRAHTLCVRVSADFREHGGERERGEKEKLEMENER